MHAFDNAVACDNHILAHTAAAAIRRIIEQFIAPHRQRPEIFSDNIEFIHHHFHSA
jgi:hypothetical protein